MTGSSRGLGQAICVALAEHGANVVGVSQSSSEETERMVKDAGGKFIWVKADLTTLDAVEEIVHTAKETFGSVDILVNNAGTIRCADENRSEELLSRIPAGRWGTPEDLMGAVVFLSSKASDYVNGHILAVDGGWLAR